VDRATLLQQLREAISSKDADIDLAETALLLSALDDPSVDLVPYRQHLDVLASDIGAMTRPGSGLMECIDTLRVAVYTTHGYSGDRRSYNDIENANLIRVIDRRRGIPVSLGIICIHAWRVQGWSAVGIHSPGHFLIQVSTTGELAILDPFHQARLLDESNLHERFTAVQEDSTENSMNGVVPVSNREILLRLQNNIRIRARQRGDTALALRTTESMLVLAKDAPVFRLEIAALKAKAGEIKAALSDIESLLDSHGAEELHEQAELLQATLKGRLN
jgi:regulator of sirC expression with transglutaminase-like and TPR domain